MFELLTALHPDALDPDADQAAMISRITEPERLKELRRRPSGPE
jgi:hypothetical protein